MRWRSSPRPLPHLLYPFLAKCRWYGFECKRRELKMSLQSSNTFLAGDAYSALRGNAAGWKAQAQNALATMQAGSINSDFVFRMLDQTAGAINAMTTWKAVAG